MSTRVKTPTRLQMEAAECGAAALGIVLEYHGSYVALEELRETCGCSRDGSRASNMVKAARHYGMVARGFKLEPARLKDMTMPVIIHWNFNHFLVLEGFKKGKAYLNDPAMGPRTVGLDEFDQAFTGVTLTFEPGENFEKQGSRPSVIPSMAARLQGSYAGLAFVVLSGVALVVPGLLIPMFSQIFVDEILLAEKQSWLWPLLLAMALTGGVQAFLTLLREQVLLNLSMKLSTSMSSQFLWHVFRLPISFFNSRFPGDVASRVQMNSELAWMLSGRLASTLLDLLLVVFYLTVMLYYDVMLTIFSILIASTNIVLFRYVSRKRLDISLRASVARSRLAGTSMSGLAMIESLKAAGSENDFFSKWSGYHAKVMNNQQDMARITTWTGAITPVLMMLNTAVILGLGSLRVMDGHMSIGMLVAFQSLVGSFLGPVNGLIQYGETLQLFRGKLAHLDDVLNNPQDPQFEPVEGAGEQDVELQGRITIRDLSFGYGELSPPLISDLNLDVKPGSRVALVGSTGSGKTTLVRLLTGTRQAWSGQILFDGIERAKIPRSLLSSSMGVVSQTARLFQGTVLDNLTLWDKTIPMSQVIKAAKDACIHDDIMAMPGGYDAQLTERGRNLSGGQRQRMELARALCTNPIVLILDEATSALDTNTEELVDRNLRRRGCTCLLIAHRLSTIRDCDEIIVLDGGVIVERGIHEELRDAGGLYASLIQAH